MKNSIFFKSDKASKAVFEKICSKNTVALALLIYLKRNTEDCFEGQYVEADFIEIKKFLNKEKETVRRAINFLSECGAIETSGYTASKLQFKINI
ncbi:hypothetical protein G7032_20055 [Pseudomonas monteilii]|uniref:hypothetical protein n=1 Tax=Pseudomonas TaxID=286 RepID=UPI001297B0BF|nr:MULTISPECIES: hypothetical protein [Pseudomonas]MBA1318146.1 hypothetical protein [Pseudomonas monteilii]MQT40044.1 hypothetical protein [Pseudomonas sp. FSL R10-0765]MQT50917.1 hypothetical protein [Pseudomonas sp. FSL R10-2398]